MVFVRSSELVSHEPQKNCTDPGSIPPSNPFRGTRLHWQVVRPVEDSTALRYVMDKRNKSKRAPAAKQTNEAPFEHSRIRNAKHGTLYHDVSVFPVFSIAADTVLQS